MGKLTSLILFLLLVGLGFCAYEIYQDLPLNSKELSLNFNLDSPIPTNTSSRLAQFAPNMRFNTNNLSYFFQPGCTDERKDQMRTAFSMISSNTGVIHFYELSSISKEPEIIVYCSESSKRSNEDEDHNSFIAGEGGPTKFLNIAPYPLIIQGEIQLYSSKYSTKCSEPLVELHELLHVFGYDHISDKNSVLYPYLSCNQKFQDEIINDLIRLYSEPAMAELYISNISASVAGKYLNFNIEVMNSGLIYANNVSVRVSNGNNLIKSFKFEDLTPGLIRTLSIQNLELPSNRITSLKFEVMTSSPEYSLENNFAEMQVKN